ncbi:hypothetical protein K474DRAFT_1660549 [Panus rudis PR-1116 ss-1]|nr:hypothetical protein K474DRAFT_1660549 [Panus rudis PR-1116 ss-1]
MTRILQKLSVQWMDKNGRSFLGLEALAITFSLPYVLFNWSILTFLFSVSYLCFSGTTTVTRAIIAPVLGIIVVLFFMALWRNRGVSGAQSGKADSPDLDLLNPEITTDPTPSSEDAKDENSSTSHVSIDVSGHEAASEKGSRLRGLQHAPPP